MSVAQSRAGSLWHARQKLIKRVIVIVSSVPDLHTGGKIVMIFAVVIMLLQFEFFTPPPSICVLAPLYYTRIEWRPVFPMLQDL